MNRTSVLPDWSMYTNNNYCYENKKIMAFPLCFFQQTNVRTLCLAIPKVQHQHHHQRRDPLNIHMITPTTALPRHPGERQTKVKGLLTRNTRDVQTRLSQSQQTAQSSNQQTARARVREALFAFKLLDYYYTWSLIVFHSLIVMRIPALVSCTPLCTCHDTCRDWPGLQLEQANYRYLGVIVNNHPKVYFNLQVLMQKCSAQTFFFTGIAYS